MDPNINIEEHYLQSKNTNEQPNEKQQQQLTRNSIVSEHDLTQYGVSLEELYGMARNFIKEKDGKAVQFSYDDRNMLTCLAKQIHYGKYRAECDQVVGIFDFVGKDRLQLWKSFGDLSKDEAMKKYINLLMKICPYFRTSMEAYKRHLDEENCKKRETQQEVEEKKSFDTNQMMTQQRERIFTNEEFLQQEEQKKKREEIHRKQVQEALNQQTYPHFKAYAEQQHPNNTSLQNELIRQLQEEHFEQYMNQVYQQQLQHQQQQAEQLRAIRRAQKRAQQQQPQQFLVESSNEHTNETQNLNDISIQVTADELQNLTLNTSNEKSLSNQSEQSNNHEKINNNSNNNQDEFDEEPQEMPPISAATLLTRKDINEFKQMVRRDNDAIIKVGSGETVTVRVPTHDDGTLIFWEFASDSYDLGFGLYFEWTISPSNNVTVHVSDSSDDEDEDTDVGVAASVNGTEAASKIDPEKGNKHANKPPCDEIIPIFRRDCHQEVFAGSHMYPGRGVYLLKFDNSYSLWRSKTLYYRVYYSK